MDLTKTVKGLYFNSDENICSFILHDGSHQQIGGAGTSDLNGIELKDLAVALYVFCNDGVSCKNISFSLDPADERNPEG